MNSEIASLSSCLIYDNRLVCGTEEVANGTLAAPLLNNLVSCKFPFRIEEGYSIPQWLMDAIHPSRKVVLLDTDDVPAQEDRIGRNVHNETEADLTISICKALTHVGLPQDEIGVICPYRV